MGCGCRGSGYKTQQQKAAEKAAQTANGTRTTVIDRSYYAAKKTPVYNGPEPKQT